MMFLSGFFCRQNICCQAFAVRGQALVSGMTKDQRELLKILASADARIEAYDYGRWSYTNEAMGQSADYDDMVNQELSGRDKRIARLTNIPDAAEEFKMRVASDWWLKSLVSAVGIWWSALSRPKLN